MRVDSLEYFRGLFDSSEAESPAEAKIHVRFEAPNIPDEVERSFIKERIEELKGEYGQPGVGDPTEVDSLMMISGGKRTLIRVQNRGISLSGEEREDLLRLHRFFCILHGRAASRKSQ